MVHSESQENGQKEAKRSRHEELEEDDEQGDGERTRVHEDKMETSFPGAVETQSPSHTSHDVEINTGNGSIARWVFKLTCTIICLCKDIHTVLYLLH